MKLIKQPHDTRASEGRSLAHARWWIQAAVLLTALSVLGGCKEKDPVLAVVNGVKITQSEFDAYLKLKHVAASDSKRREHAFEEFLEREGLASVIEKQPDLDSELIEAELAELRREILISRYFDGFLKKKVSDEAIKNYYDAHAKDYEQRKVHAAHILVRTNPKMSKAEVDAKRTTAQEVHSKLQEGQTFAQLASQHSDDRVSGAKGGDLGWLREGSIDPEFSKRVFSMKAGSVSAPFKTKFGFHIVTVLEEPTVVRKPYAAVLGDIRHQLRAEAKKAELERLTKLVSVKKQGEYKAEPAASAAPSASAQASPVSPPIASGTIKSATASRASLGKLGTALSPPAASATPPQTKPGQPPVQVTRNQGAGQPAAKPPAPRPGVAKPAPRTIPKPRAPQPAVAKPPAAPAAVPGAQAPAAPAAPADDAPANAAPQGEGQ